MNRNLKSAYKRLLEQKLLGRKNFINESVTPGEMIIAGWWERLRGLLGKAFQNRFPTREYFLKYMRQLYDMHGTPGNPQGIRVSRNGFNSVGSGFSRSNKYGVIRMREFLDELGRHGIFGPTNPQRVEELFIDPWGGHFVKTSNNDGWWYLSPNGPIQMNPDYIPGAMPYPGNPTWFDDDYVPPFNLEDIPENPPNLVQPEPPSPVMTPRQPRNPIGTTPTPPQTPPIDPSEIWPPGFDPADQAVSGIIRPNTGGYYG
jgi:hypothetical protein